jgi:hypothetical protein
VEAAIGKSIDRKNVTVILIQPFTKISQRRWMGELSRSEIAETEANGVGIVGTDFLPNSQRIGFERIKGLLPVFSPMDVRAVGQVQAMIEFHLLRSAGVCRAPDVRGLRWEATPWISFPST